MRSVGRSVLAVLAGIVVAMIVMFAFEGLSSHLFPLPPGIDLHDQQAMTAHMDELPIGAFLMVLAGWAVGSFVGAWAAARLAGRARLVHGLVVGGFFLAATVMVMMTIPHPLWMEISGIVALAGCSYVGARLAATPPPAPARVALATSFRHARSRTARFITDLSASARSAFAPAPSHDLRRAHPRIRHCRSLHRFGGRAKARGGADARPTGRRRCQSLGAGRHRRCPG